MIDVNETSVTYLKDGKEIILNDVDTVLQAVGYQSDKAIIDVLDKMNLSYNVLGDSNHPGKIKNAISDAYQICKDL